jgi:hypothetical protein
MKKYTLKKSKFINWYFADMGTRIDFGNDAIMSLELYGKLNVTIEGLFDACGYIPKWLCEGEDADEDLLPSEVELIPNPTEENRKQYPRKCDKCNKGMYEGFIIEDTYEYFCTIECLKDTYTEEESDTMLDEGSMYYTDWSDDDIDYDDEPIYENN